MSTKRKSQSNIAGRLSSLLKEYESSDVAIKLQKNVLNIPSKEFYPEEIALFNLFEEKYFDLKNSKASFIPSYIFLNEGKYIIFSGIESYILAKKNKTSFKGYLVNDVSFNDIFLYVIDRINKNDYNPLIKANAYLTLKKDLDITYEELSSVLNISKPQIINTIGLLKLPEEIKEDLINGEISQTLVRPLISLTDDKEKVCIYQKIKNNKYSSYQVNELVKEYKLKQKNSFKILIKDKKITINCSSHEEAKKIAANIEKFKKEE